MSVAENKERLAKIEALVQKIHEISLKDFFEIQGPLELIKTTPCVIDITMDRDYVYKKETYLSKGTFVKISEATRKKFLEPGHFVGVAFVEIFNPQVIDLGLIRVEVDSLINSVFIKKVKPQ